MSKTILLAYDFNETDYYPILAMQKELPHTTGTEILKEACKACNEHDYVSLIDSVDLERIGDTTYYEVQAYSINMYKGHKI